MTQRTASELFESKVRRGEGCWDIDTYLRPDGYRYLQVQGKKAMAHRVSWEIHNGPIPEGLFIDHICRNRACVNPEHLRLATSKQNAENKPIPNPSSTTNVKGVWWRSDRQCYIAQVNHNGVRVLRKAFRNLEDAERAVIEARRKYFTHNDYDRVA